MKYIAVGVGVALAGLMLLTQEPATYTPRDKSAQVPKFIPSYTDASGEFHMGYFSLGGLSDMAMDIPVRIFNAPPVGATSSELPDRTYTEPSGPMYMNAIPNTTPYGSGGVVLRRP